MLKKGTPSTIVFFVVLAILVRALIPAGFMPDLKTGNAFQMVICTATGAQTVTVDGDYNPIKKSDHAAPATKMCDFSLTQVNASPVVVQLFVLAVLAFAAAFITSRKEFFLARRRYYSSAPARAPPVFA